MPVMNRSVNGKKMISWQMAAGLYLVLINAWGFAAMGFDKRKAQMQAWRTPERHLFALAVLGGSVGTWLGMQTFRHKTQHKSFAIGIPLIFGGQILAAVIIGQQYLS